MLSDLLPSGRDDMACLHENGKPLKCMVLKNIYYLFKCREKIAQCSVCEICSLCHL